jgi:hypothetical protein
MTTEIAFVQLDFASKRTNDVEVRRSLKLNFENPYASVDGNIRNRYGELFINLYDDNHDTRLVPPFHLTDRELDSGMPTASRMNDANGALEKVVKQIVVPKDPNRTILCSRIVRAEQLQV